jgi:hypothetical protein
MFIVLRELLTRLPRLASSIPSGRLRMTEESKARYRPGLHVYLYLWVALIVVGILPALLITHLLYSEAQFDAELATFGVLLAVFQCAFWLARRRCSSANLSAWEGLLYIASYMTIGVGYFSLFIVVPCVIIAVVALLCIALGSFADPDGSSAAQRFRQVVIWFGRHRMYQ